MMAEVGKDDTAAAFDRLQREKLEQAWRADLPGSTEPHVVVALPSYSVERSVYEHYRDRVGPLEHRYLYAVLRSKDPGTRTIYLSSEPVDAEVVDGYLALAPPETHDTIRRNSLLLSPDDPSPRPLAEKVLDNPAVLDAVTRFVGDDPALIEPWNVTEAERDLAVALGIPINGSEPSLRCLATKSAGRRLFREAGVPLPAGIEDVTSPDQVVAAITSMRRDDPGLPGVVVKLDDSVAGDGNVVLRFDDLAPDDHDRLAAMVREALPDWYVDVLAHGGVVEELVVGDDFCSPSGQGALRPDGSVEVVATHDQRLGGDNGQVYEGCSLPAREGYAADIAAHVAAVGEALVAQGAIGRFAVDFAAVRRRGRWELFALEINLRKGGTTHPLGITRFLTGGRYDAACSRFVLPDGSTRCYGATDNLVDERWRTRPPAEARARLTAAGLDFDHGTQVGVVPHLLDCLPVDGRMGYTAIGRSADEVGDLEARIEKALRE
jgi:hypothetical protein